MAKTGRPPLKEKAKTKLLAVRVSHSKFTEIQEFAQQHNITLTQVVRAAIDKYINA